VRALRGPKLGLSYSVSISSDGPHLWVANAGNGGSVTELVAASGALVKVIKGRPFGFSLPQSVSSDGTHVWIANHTGNSVTELDASTGKLVRVLRN
jgi:DNA-binding beta-propeller fold protein YncE